MTIVGNQRKWLMVPPAAKCNSPEFPPRPVVERDLEALDGPAAGNRSDDGTVDLDPAIKERDGFPEE